MCKGSAKKSDDHVENQFPVPETDTGGQVENTKGREVTLSKELGKMTPQLREKGCHREVAAVKRPRRLFSKNIGLCKLERGGIGADACPVPEG